MFHDQLFRKRDVQIGIVRRLQRQPRRGQVLPPVVVPLEAIVPRPLLAVEEAHPGVPRLLVGAAQVAHVVHLEPRRPALVRRLEHQVRAAHLVELELLGVAAERRARRIERQRGIRALVVVHGVGLQREHRRRAPLHPALVERPRHLVVVAEEAVAEVEPRGVGGGREVRRRPPVAVAVHRREHRADGAVAVAGVLRHAGDGEVRQRLVRRVARARGALRGRVEQAEGEPARKAAEQLGGAEDRGRLLRHRVAVGAGQLRRAPDAPAVVQPLAVAVDLVAVDVEAEQPAPGHEERPALVEERSRTR